MAGSVCLKLMGFFALQGADDLRYGSCSEEMGLQIIVERHDSRKWWPTVLTKHSHSPHSITNFLNTSLASWDGSVNDSASRLLSTACARHLARRPDCTRTVRPSVNGSTAMRLVYIEETHNCCVIARSRRRFDGGCCQILRRCRKIDDLSSFQ